MSAVARKALAKLLASAESASSKPASRRAISLRLSEASFPDYLSLPSAAEKGACNAAFRLAARAGAIDVEWDARAESNAHANKLVLLDADALADHLDIVPRWRQIAAARQRLDVHLPSYPVLSEVLDAWNRGVTARGSRAGDVQDWLDAIIVSEYCRQHIGDDIPVRRLSARLFGNSKRVEALWPQLDALQQGTLSQAPQSDAEEVFAQLGLVKFPPTLLLAFSGDLATRGARVPTLQPYVGVSPRELERVWFATGTSCLMSVENLTTFHELALQRTAHAEVAIVYTGGMPSPSWLRAHRVLLEGLPQACPVIHWGDVDAGGFRIAAHIARACSEAARDLKLHAMVVDQSHAPASTQINLSPSELAQIQRICVRHGWLAEWEAVRASGVAHEQEALSLSWPLVASS